MITMKSKRPLNVDIGWIGAIPNDDRKPGESNGHYQFFIQCVWCDRRSDQHLLNCVSEEELATLFSLYAERLAHTLPFKMFPVDFQNLAKNTWNDPEYKASKK